MKKTIKDIIESVNESRRILLIAHIQPDGDTVGACFALKAAIKQSGKEAAVACGSGMPRQYAFLAGKAPYFFGETPPAAYELAIAVDCADRERVGGLVSVFDAAEKTVNIDHHRSNTRFADINLVSDVSSAGEIVYGILREMDTDIDRYIARCLYAAIATDTGNFTYSNTNPNAMRITAELMTTGFDLADTANRLFRTRTLAATKLIGLAVGSIVLQVDGALALMCLSKKDIISAGAKDEECENVVNYAREIKGVRIAVFIRETDTGTYKASFRSDDGYDVAAIAAIFGGGGHRNAAGCTVKGNLADILNRLVTEAKKQLHKKDCT